MTQRFNHISFLTDYGTRDEFVGVVKCVIADIAPHVHVIDITHDIPAFDVRAGALALARAVAYVPKGVILAVVDPGVGSARRSIAVSVAGGEGVFIGPDNGLLATGVALAGGAEFAVELTNAKYHLPSPGTTFAGRDIFGPVAAHICNGVDLRDLGNEIDPASILPGIVPISREENGHLVGEVTWVDNFGNCQLNIGPEDIAQFGSPVRIAIGNSDSPNYIVRSVAVVRNFSEIGSGLGLVVDSYGMLAICADRGSAATELDIGPTNLVTISQDPNAGGGVTATVRLGSKPN